MKGYYCVYKIPPLESSWLLHTAENNWDSYLAYLTPRIPLLFQNSIGGICGGQMDVEIFGKYYFSPISSHLNQLCFKRITPFSIRSIHNFPHVQQACLCNNIAINQIRLHQNRLLYYSCSIIFPSTYVLHYLVSPGRLLFQISNILLIFPINFLISFT